MLKIAYVGNFRPVHSTENHLRQTLELLGHEVIPLQEDEHHAFQIYATCVERQADLMLYTRTWGIAGNGLEMMEKLKQQGIPTASYHLDLYWGLDRSAGIATDPFWRTKYVFTPDGGHNKEFKQARVNHFYIKPGVFGPECNYGTPRQEYMHDVIFVGSEAYHHEYPYRPQLVAWLRETYGLHFGKYGGHDVQVRNQDLNDLYASAKVVVGDSLNKDFKQHHYWSDRVYETLGRGGFLIHPYIKGLDEEFIDGEHLVFYKYGEFDQLKKLIDHYILNYAERERIRLAGHMLVKNNYTYTQRLTQMLEILSKHEPQIKARLESQKVEA